MENKLLGSSRCCRCGEAKNKSMILNCGHSLCPTCASSDLSIYRTTLVCETCHQTTPIAPSHKPASKSPLKTNFAEIRAQAKTICRDHPDQELTYFCEDCRNGLVCSECVVHGIHKSHKVATVAKAYPAAVEKIERSKKELAEKIRVLESANEGLEVSKKNTFAGWKGLRSKILSQFDQLEAIIAKKREVIERNLEDMMKEDIRKIEEIQERNFASSTSMQTIFENLNSKVSSLNNVYRSLIVQIDLLEFYSNGYRNCLKSSESEFQLTEQENPNEKVQELAPHVNMVVDQLKGIADQVTDVSSLSEISNLLSERSIESAKKRTDEQSSPQKFGSANVLADSLEIYGLRPNPGVTNGLYMVVSRGRGLAGQ